MEKRIEIQTNASKQEIKNSSPSKNWRILIADDEIDVHTTTKLILTDTEFNDKKIIFLSAYNKKETIDILQKTSDIAVILLDVVMDTEESGLEIIEFIREKLKNDAIRIILRTGQAGKAPLFEILKKFDINDYKQKEEVTNDSLYTTVIASLRSYDHIKSIEEHSKQLEQNLQEKEILLKEIHHRVKNNLQIISSLLSMQASKISDKAMLNMFQNSKDRVRSMSIIHEKLYQSNSFTKIKFSEYIETMAVELFTTYEISSNIKLKLNINEVYLNIEKAIPCGLIINEIVSNSLKHAYKENEEGEIKINLFQEKNQINLIISDNGCGLPKDIDFDNTKTLGLQLVNVLMDQLEGNIDLISKNGTQFTISFKQDTGD